MNILNQEIEKFSRLVQEINQQDASYKGVLMICFTMPQASASESRLHNLEVGNVEVVLINLGSPEMRRNFFELASCFKEEHATIIEDMIESETS